MRSDLTKVGKERAPHRALFKATGITDEEMGRPFTGIANSANEFIPGSMTKSLHGILPQISSIS